MNPITANSLAHMRDTRRTQGSALAVTAVATLLGGCSSSHQATPPSSTSSAVAAGPQVQAAISPGGVTTSLNAPAGSTEEEYYQACHWARAWMADKPGDPHDQIEPYLAMVQASANGENGTWNKPWATLTPEQQAGLIVAVKAAADGGCD
jgi:Putative lipoprotein LpqV